MSTLKPMICECCGGHIDRASLVCKMCGTPYRLDEDMKPIRITEYRGRLVTISGEAHIPSYILAENPEYVSRHTLQEMAISMAEKLLPLVEFEHTMNPRTQEMITYGRIRVAAPSSFGETTKYFER